MKSIIQYVFMVVIALILFFAFGYFYHRNNNTPQSITTSKSDTLYLKDTTKHISIINQFYSHSYTVLPTGKIDTNAIIKNYYTKCFIADTLADSLVRIIINDTLFNNNLIFRKRQYELLKPYQKQINTTHSITVTVSQKGIYAGAFFGFNASALQSAGLEANYITHKFNYGLGYDFKNNAVTGKILINLSKH